MVCRFKLNNPGDVKKNARLYQIFQTYLILFAYGAEPVSDHTTNPLFYRNALSHRAAAQTLLVYFIN